MAENISNIMSATGNAVAADVLEGKTFSTDAGLGITGMMPNKGCFNSNIYYNSYIDIPAGYHDGTGRVVSKKLSVAAYELGRPNRFSITDGVANLSDMVIWTGTTKMSMLRRFRMIAIVFGATSDTDFPFGASMDPKYNKFKIDIGKVTMDLSFFTWQPHRSGNNTIFYGVAHPSDFGYNFTGSVVLGDVDVKLYIDKLSWNYNGVIVPGVLTLIGLV